MLHKDQEGGLRGKPYQGVSPLYLFLRFVRVRRYAGRGSLPCPAFRPHFFGACPKKRCRAAKEKRFEASTSPWWAHPPLPFGRKPQRDELVRQVGLCPVGKLAGQSQPDAVGGYVGASSPWERRAGPNSSRGGTHKRVSLGLHPVSLRKSKEMGWNWQQVAATSAQGNGAHVTAQDKAASSLCFLRARRYVGRWSGRSSPDLGRG